MRRHAKLVEKRKRIKGKYNDWKNLGVPEHQLRLPEPVGADPGALAQEIVEVLRRVPVAAELQLADAEVGGDQAT